jgi:hypothetical protein
MGNYWQKKFVGLTVHGRRATMSNFIFKLLMIEGVLPRSNDELRDIVMASDGDGYEALYNILRFVHPKLTDEKVEVKIPTQGVTDSFASHVKNIRRTIENEAIRGRGYTRYEGLQLVLGTLHPKFEPSLRHKSEMAFENHHDHANNVPFELQMSNLGKTLGGWALKLGLNDTRAPRVSKISFAETDDAPRPRIASLHGDPACEFCQMPGHTKDNCQWFVNHILATHFAKENPSLAAKILRDNKSFMRIKRHTGDRPNGTARGSSHHKPHVSRIVAQPEPLITPSISRVSTSDAPSDHDGCDEIIHDMAAMVCHVAADDSSDGSVDASSILLDRPVEFDEFECDAGESYDEHLIARITANWDEELRPVQTDSNDASVYSDCVSISGECSGNEQPTALTLPTLSAIYQRNL